MGRLATKLSHKYHLVIQSYKAHKNNELTKYFEETYHYFYLKSKLTLLVCIMEFYFTSRGKIMPPVHTYKSESFFKYSKLHKNNFQAEKEKNGITISNVFFFQKTKILTSLFA